MSTQQIASIMSFLGRRVGGTFDLKAYEVILALVNVADAADVALEAALHEPAEKRFIGHRGLKNAMAKLTALDLVDETKG